MEGFRELTLAEIDNGGAEELFARELRQVMQNIDDPSTDPTAKRKITLEIEFTPNQNRDMGVVEISAKSKMAPARSTGSSFVLRRQGRELTPWEPALVQPSLGLDNVSSIDHKSRAAGERDDD